MNILNIYISLGVNVMLLGTLTKRVSRSLVFLFIGIFLNSILFQPLLFAQQPDVNNTVSCGDSTPSTSDSLEEIKARDKKFFDEISAAEKKELLDDLNEILGLTILS